MPISHTIDRDLHLIRLVGSGQVTDQDMLGCVAALRADPHLEPGMNTLSDMREIEVDFTSHGLLKLIDLMADPEEGGGEARAAIVVSTDVAFGMGRMLENLADDRVDPLIQIFRSIEEARSWLGLD